MTENQAQLQEPDCADSEDEYLGFRGDPPVHTETFIKVCDKNKYLEPPIVYDERDEPETFNIPLPLTASDPHTMPDEVIQTDSDTDGMDGEQESVDIVEPSGEEVPGNTDTDDVRVFDQRNIDNDNSNIDLPVEETETVETSSENTNVRKSVRLRRAPGCFHYPQLGKPLISFAQSFLESFNQALDSFSNSSGHSIYDV